MNQNPGPLTNDLAVDAVCLEFEQKLRQGKAPLIESYLQGRSLSEEQKLVAQLVSVEIEYHRESGSEPDQDDYAIRFPAHCAAIQAVFEASIVSADETIETSTAEQPGSVIGHYRLLEQIGEGGMGIVFMAEQQRPVQRKVALKIIKPGTDTKQVIARFEAERQALAMMDHSNVARVLDAGSTESGRPYFVMELVRGVPITEYCDQNKLPTSERLDLFIKVCQAVQHAHTKGIIHRDIKPTNVLVTLHDGVPVPKIIDFGVAKAINQQLTQRTLFTAFTQMIGTPLYMSPEQAEMSGLDVDTRSDVYSLGVLLYELLTGRTPVDRQRFRTAAFDEIRRIIREEDPVKPSTAISTMGNKGSSVSALRRTDVNKLRQSLSGELDWIVMKALEKDRTRRFQTASDLANDVSRHLRGETVEACPPTVSYRLQKFVRRYQAQVAVAGVFVFLLATSTLIAWTLYAQASRAKIDADAARDSERTAKELALSAKSEAEKQRDTADNNFRIAKAQEEQAARLAEQLKTSLYDYNIIKADAAIQKENDANKALQFLLSCDESKRGWEWHWIHNAADRHIDLQLHGAPIVFSALAPSGKLVAVIDSAGLLRIHDVSNGNLVWSVDTSRPFIDKSYVVFSKDGSKVATAHIPELGAGEVRVWDVVEKTELFKLEDQGPVVFRLSPDGQHVAICRFLESNIEYWKIGESKPRWTMQTTGGYQWFHFSPDGRRLYRIMLAGILDTQGSAVLSCWQIGQTNVTNVWTEEVEGSSFGEISPDGSTLITTGSENTIVIRDANSGKEMYRHKSGNDGGTLLMRFDPTGRFLATANRELVVHDWQSKTVLWKESLLNRHPQEISFSADGSRLSIVVPDKNAVRIFKTNVDARQYSLSGHERVVLGCIQNDAGREIRTVSGDGTMRSWNSRTGQELSLRQLKNSISCVASANNAIRFATGGPDGVRLWDEAASELIHWSDLKSVTQVAFSPGGQYVAASSQQGNLRIWDTADYTQIAQGKLDSELTGLVFLDDQAQKLACLTEQGAIAFWSPLSEEFLGPFETGERAAGFVLSPDGSKLLAGCGRGVQIWDLQGKRLFVSSKTHEDDVTAVAFNADATRVFSGSADGMLKVWNLHSGEPLLSISAHNPIQPAGTSSPRGIESITWSESQQAIITCGADGITKVWKSSTPALAEIAERRFVQAATAVVNDLYHRSSAQRDVLNTLTTLPSISDRVKQIAVQIAGVRGDRPGYRMQTALTKTSVDDVHAGLSQARDRLVAFAEHASGIGVRLPMSSSTPVRVHDWLVAVFEFVRPQNITKKELEVLVGDAMETYPHAHHFHYIMGVAHAHRGEWEQAYHHLDVSLRRLPPTSDLWFRQAYEFVPLAAYLGRIDRFREVCQQTIESGFAFSNINFTPNTGSLPHRTTKMLCLVPNGYEKPDDVMNHIAKFVMPQAGTGGHSWRCYSQGVAELRAGEYERAIETLDSIVPDNYNVFAILGGKIVLAMAHHHAGQFEKAKTSLAAAEAMMQSDSPFLGHDGYPSPGPDFYFELWSDWLVTQVFYEEAAKLIREPLAH